MKNLAQYSLIAIDFGLYSVRTLTTDITLSRYNLRSLKQILSGVTKNMNVFAVTDLKHSDRTVTELAKTC